MGTGGRSAADTAGRAAAPAPSPAAAPAPSPAAAPAPSPAARALAEDAAARYGDAAIATLADLVAFRAAGRPSGRAADAERRPPGVPSAQGVPRQPGRRSRAGLHRSRRRRDLGLGHRSGGAGSSGWGRRRRTADARRRAAGRPGVLGRRSLPPRYHDRAGPARRPPAWRTTRRRSLRPSTPMRALADAAIRPDAAVDRRAAAPSTRCVRWTPTFRAVPAAGASSSVISTSPWTGSTRLEPSPPGGHGLRGGPYRLPAEAGPEDAGRRRTTGRHRIDNARAGAPYPERGSPGSRKTSSSRRDRRTMARDAPRPPSNRRGR